MASVSGDRDFALRYPSHDPEASFSVGWSLAQVYMVMFAFENSLPIDGFPDDLSLHLFLVTHWRVG